MLLLSSLGVRGLSKQLWGGTGQCWKGSVLRQLASLVEVMVPLRARCAFAGTAHASHSQWELAPIPITVGCFVLAHTEDLCVWKQCLMWTLLYLSTFSVCFGNGLQLWWFSSKVGVRGRALVDLLPCLLWLLCWLSRAMSLHQILLLWTGLSVELCQGWTTSPLPNCQNNEILCCLTPEGSNYHCLYLERQNTTLTPGASKCVIVMMLCLSHAILHPDTWK